MSQHLRIGGASGFWGDSSVATAQLLASPGLDFIVYDYLAEITMAILARARAKDPETGYATDFVSAAMAPNLAEIARQGVRIVSNAGGMNPKACAAALEAEIKKQGVTLKVAVVTGDDLYRVFSLYWMLVGMRERMGASAWKRVYGHIIRIIDREIAPRFDAELVAIQRQRAKVDLSTTRIQRVLAAIDVRGVA